MNKTLVITTIALIAVVMGLSTVAPALQQAFAHDVREAKGRVSLTECPPGFSEGTTTPGTHPDHNFNGVVCRNNTGGGIVDDNVPTSAGPP